MLIRNIVESVSRDVYVTGYKFHSLAVFDPIHSTSHNYTDTWISSEVADEQNVWLITDITSKGFMIPLFYVDEVKCAIFELLMEEKMKQL